MNSRQHDVTPDEAPEAPEPGSSDPEPAGVADAPRAGSDAPPRGDDPDIHRQLEEQKDRYLRLAAEFDNYRKRSAKERLEAGPRAQGDLVKQLLDPLDDIMRFAHLDPSQVDAKTVVDGVSMVEKKLFKTFAGFGAEVLDPAGERFDPNQHEAVMTEPAASADEDDLVARVFQVGYRFNGQLLRPARVVVKQWNG